MGGNLIESFWEWWRTEGASAVAAAIEAGDASSAFPLIDQRVAAIHDGLAWEIGPGTVSEHQLVVTGNPDRRAVARRWLNAAPSPDPVWSYADSLQRRPLGEFRLGVGSVVVHYADVIVACQRRQNRLDVRVYHPSFGGLEQRQQFEIAFLALDHALGEVAVEQWLGAVDTTKYRPAEGYSLAELVGVVDALAAENTYEDGTPAWVGLQWDGENGRVVAAAQVPLCSSQAPNLDTHIAISVPYQSFDEAGLPTEQTWDALEELRDQLESVLGTAGRVLACETTAGVHTVHVYADSVAVDVVAIESAAATWAQGAVIVASHDDPKWSDVAHLRT
ncbi:hypothetical protein A5630_04195 [Mycolicibacterium mucogenicum]|uniref:Uncharacterized protein n=1 Tax=Mycolicibacterium mucogenicum TaxID=56689 RepID=A0A1A3GQL3_MYCMU|nr:hypothetical protein A5630_04195 [Mycolicibacterium mucogenicum]